ncbi:arylsulfatase [Flavobacterium sp. ZT3R18]|uniref:arylsulfatase n=1 Tax=Flavobacterium sp. ZT3R18 TaxID=2594429 RepID=UPI00117AC5C3|nr:arylsulfatase [Flavobacterium sp. ZT3R18]TRX34197.1 arylsulfatase [Flavobacterium sp. ZT3R18]
MKNQINFLFLIAILAVVFGCKKVQQKEEIKTALPKPNILLIVADDLGYSDVASFGGNIQTPVLSQLAKESLSFSNFYVQPTCSPTRSSLLTGNDNHVAGLGIMSEMDYPELHALNLPGYSGNLSKQVVTIPEVLRDNGYHTYMTGKWHLGEGPGKDPFDRGFEETYILGTGGGSHYNDKKALSPLQKMDYTRNGKIIELPDNFYSTKNYTNSMIQFIDKNKADQKPFFAFLSYTAVHDPLHAPKEYLDKYKGKFDKGWDSLWSERLKNLKKLGIVPKDLNKFTKNPAIPKWETLPHQQKVDFARDMEVYAAMLDYMDMSIGRVFDYLKKQGLYDNTMIVFMSDNGANGATAGTYPGNEDGKYHSTFNNSLDNRGLKNSYVEVGPGWAQASSSPFRFFKSFTTEGGIKAPLLIKMPGQAHHAGQWSRSFIHVTDLMPTVLELTGANYPKKYKGNTIHPHIGKSLIPVLNGNSVAIHESDGQGWELFEMKAYIKGKWKILRLPQPMGTGEWQLYDIEKDPAETTDLSTQFPDIRKKLINEWNDYARKNEVYDHKGHFDALYRKSFVPKENH